MTSETFSIRLAGSADYDGVVACIQAAFTKWIEVIGMKPMALTADYRDFIDRKVIYVIDGDQTGEVAGLLIIIPTNDSLYVDTLAVNPAYQRRGLGQRLLDYAAQHAFALGLTKLTLVTNEKQVSNQEFYRKYGFVETHRRLIEPGRVGVWMAKMLATE